MFNNDLKASFISEYTDSISTAKSCASVFNATEKYEQKASKDIFEMSQDELQEVIDGITGLRAKSKYGRIVLLREYVKWCLSKNVPNVNRNIFQVSQMGLDKVRTMMAANPTHLQRYLNQLYEKESEETVDNVFRCYFWLAYAGVPEESICDIKTSDVHLEDMYVLHNGISYTIYKEAIPCIKNCMYLQSFLYKHPLYAPSRRDRIESDILMRGIKALPNIFTIRSQISKRAGEAFSSGITSQKLSYNRVALSGVYYRTHELELAGVPVDFAEETMKFMDGKTYKLSSGRNKIDAKARRIEKEYLEDYDRWKIAFMI